MRFCWTHSSCVSGYMGERCQFSDLEWWDLQQAEQEKRRNVAIAACMVLLVSLLSIAACLTYCYGWGSLFKISEFEWSNNTPSSVTRAANAFLRRLGKYQKDRANVNYNLLKVAVTKSGRVFHYPTWHCLDTTWFQWHSSVIFLSSSTDHMCNIKVQVQESTFDRVPSEWN